MKTRTMLAATSLIVLGGLGTAAGVASAQGEPAAVVDTGAPQRASSSAPTWPRSSRCRPTTPR